MQRQKWSTVEIGMFILAEKLKAQIPQNDWITFVLIACELFITNEFRFFHAAQAGKSYRPFPQKMHSIGQRYCTQVQ